MAELERRMAGARGASPASGETPHAAVARAEPPVDGSGRPAGSPGPGSAGASPAGLPEAGTPAAQPPPLELAPAVARDAPDGEPVWPDESAEAAFLAQAGFGERQEPAAAPESFAPAPETPVEKEVLPALEDLLPRIPAEVVAALDEHFRARFTGVRRIPKEALKP